MLLVFRARFVLIAVVLASCGAEGHDREAVLEAIAVHADRFETFDAWARRTVIAEPSAPASSAFAETLFAPLRGDDAVIDAWVVREGTSPRRWQMRSIDPEIELYDVRAPRLGSIRAALASVVYRETRIETVIIERAQNETASTHVVVAVVFAVTR